MRRSFGLLTISCLFAAVLSFANTIYVDPVNGSDTYLGDSPFFIPGTTSGPVKTLNIAITKVTMHGSILVLMDGVYIVDNSKINDIDYRRLYLMSYTGPENCTMKLTNAVSFHYGPYEPYGVSTCFDGITFDFENNAATPILIDGDSTVQFMNCVFTGFQPAQPTNPMIVIDSAQPFFRDCSFVDNHLYMLVRSMYNSYAEFENCNFEYNECPNSQASLTIINNDVSTLTLRGCTFINNYSSSSFHLIQNKGNATVQGCVFRDNTSSYNNLDACVGIYNESPASITVTDSDFENFSAPASSPSYATAIVTSEASSLKATNCRFIDNKAGIHIMANSTPCSVSITDCEFTGNRNGDSTDPSVKTGAIIMQAVTPSLSVEIRGCSFTRNHSGIRAAADIKFTAFDISNCVFADNLYCGVSVDSYRSLLYKLKVTNCTFVNNGQSEFATEYAVVKNTIVRHIPNHTIANNGQITINYSNLQGGWTGPGTGNIDADPLFADGGIWNPDPLLRVFGTDFHLKSVAGRWSPEEQKFVLDTVQSQCIDAGDPADVPYFEPIGSGGRVNMGAYGNTHEASLSDLCDGGHLNTGLIFADINKDCLVNLTDFAIMASDWLDSTIQDEPM